MGKGAKGGKRNKSEGKKIPSVQTNRRRDAEEIVVPRNEALEWVEKRSDNALTREAKDLGVTSAKIIAHVFVVLLLVVVGVAAHFFIKDTLGDPRVADRIPIRYAVELGDVAVIFALVIKLIWYIFKGEKKLE